MKPVPCIAVIGFVALVFLVPSIPVTATVFYVSSSEGDDGNDGWSPDTAFETISHVNSLAFLPGDEILFKCSDIWNGEMLIITSSGTPGIPIVFGSYPTGCDDKPVLSGSLSISGWTGVAANLFRADLSAGANAGRFPDGINQLFRNGVRLPMGRWPNIQGHLDGGYSTVDAHDSATAQITDNELPAADWTGAAIHMKGIRWYIMNREVVASTGTTLTLNEDVFCYTGDCEGWGYFINSHLATLDLEGEWYTDVAANHVYLYTVSGPPADGEIEGSVIRTGSGAYLGGIILGTNLWEQLTDVTVENFDIRNWFDSGITLPVNFELDDPERLIIRDNIISDVDSTGIRLATWIWNDGDDSGWRGGEYLTVQDNIIDGANHYGIDGYSSFSTFQGNQIRNIGLIGNLNRSGMGCGITGTNCTENGAGFRLKIHDPVSSGHNNIIRLNTVDRVGMQGFDIFGPDNLLEKNFIREACWSKGDCGGIRTYGGGDFASTGVRNITIRNNIIVDTLGNTDGNHPTFDPLFGFGIYIDHYSDNISVSGNTVVNSTAAGVLMQNSRGSVTGSVLHNNDRGNLASGQVVIAGAPAEVSMMDNVLYGISPDQLTLRTQNISNLIDSNRNAFFNPYRDRNIVVSTGWDQYSLEEWRTASGMDPDSWKHWFTLETGDDPLSVVFYNPTNQLVPVDLGIQIYLDLEQTTVSGTLWLGPYASEILILTDETLPEVPASSPWVLMAVFTFLILARGRWWLLPFKCLDRRLR